MKRLCKLRIANSFLNRIKCAFLTLSNVMENRSYWKEMRRMGEITKSCCVSVGEKKEAFIFKTAAALAKFKKKIFDYQFEIVWHLFYWIGAVYFCCYIMLYEQQKFHSILSYNPIKISPLPKLLLCRYIFYILKVFMAFSWRQLIPFL